MTVKLKKFKKKLLRNNEYYDFQEIQDNLYKQSKDNMKFKNLMELITDDRNILLAYRNIKRNKGSKTPGTNFNNILKIADTEPKYLIEYVKERLKDYKPEPVRRIEIPKDGGTATRPLGIPCIEDRLIQQCIKQVLEPICEAKFHAHNYGFRPNRSTHHAISRMTFLANRAHLHYVVDIDIKGFFDNVNHGKLLKQMWSLGIQDKSLLTIISKMLKAEIDGIGIPQKGTPQGGILSPLLSNIVLNELDWWISNQWETFEPRHKYTSYNKFSALKSSKLKQMFIVRYADDFKLMCRDYETAQKALIAVKNWLKERLDLDISPEKSKVINIRKNYSNFLGFKLKIIKKGKKKVIKSNINDKATKKIIKGILERIKEIKKSPTVATVNRYNASILGLHNYYRYATYANIDFSKIAFLVSKNLYNSTKRIRGKTGNKSKAYINYYGKYNLKIVYIASIALFPIAGIKTKNAMNFSRNICNFTKEGRELIHDNLKGVNHNALKYIMENPIQGETTEYNDNRVSLYVGQNGKCSVTGEPLLINNMDSHHKIPRELGGKDEYANLTFVICGIHKLIHAITKKTILNYINKMQKFINESSLIKINKLRKLVGNCELYIS
ncbi:MULTISPECIES: group II intron reverse transcriptase/maturase [Clostridium]|uniref:Group II intron reverse transcriptase/maturase n=1 Tax=Clostridium frigoriphilum TaxID=443253 RepID=A0ABU7UQK3_9CLOT|nr:group II intron reverse transcriptase/maturase [Clostridium sp. DSM 17811]MBU3098915.1 group II intron reverse transcriptase/maturase [Clostridium sp. DSM 17811]